MRKFLLEIAICLVPCAGSAATISTNGLIDYFDANVGINLNDDGQVIGWTNQVAGSNNVKNSDLQTSVVSGPNGQQMVRFTNSTGSPSTVKTGLLYNQTGSITNGYTIIAVTRFDLTPTPTENYAYTNAFNRIFRISNDDAGVFLRRDAASPFPGQNLEFKSGNSARPYQPYLYDATTNPAGYLDDEVAILMARATNTSLELYFNGTLVSSTTFASRTWSNFPGEWEFGHMRGDLGAVLLYGSTATDLDLGLTGLTLANAYGVTWDATWLPVPEPGSFAMLAFGMLSLWLFRRR